MVEFIVTIGIGLGSVLMLAYWFRYSCVLILSARTAQDYATQIATANNLAFANIQSQLADCAAAQFDGLRDALDRDYERVQALLSAANDGTQAIENKMLEANYRLNRAMYSVTRSISQSSARRALDEMSQVVAHFANSVGECAAGAAA